MGFQVRIGQSCPSNAEWLRQAKAPEPHEILWMLNRRGSQKLPGYRGEIRWKGTLLCGGTRVIHVTVLEISPFRSPGRLPPNIRTHNAEGSYS